MLWVSFARYDTSQLSFLRCIAGFNANIWQGRTSRKQVGECVIHGERERETRKVEVEAFLFQQSSAYAPTLLRQCTQLWGPLDVIREPASDNRASFPLPLFIAAGVARPNDRPTDRPTELPSVGLCRLSPPFCHALTRQPLRTIGERISKSHR